MLAYASDDLKTPVAYCHYRWEQDPLPEDVEDESDIVPIMYIYEVQLKPNVRGQGLASYMMHLLEDWVSS
jgi:GNAT superfamily N-acetyltransferase